MRVLLFATFLGIVTFVSGSDEDFIVQGDSCSFFENTDICSIYFMDFQEKRSCGWGREEVLCRKVSRGSWQRNSNDSVLRVVSYNVRELPHLFSRKGERERTCRVPNSVNRQFPDADIVVFQELFDKGCLRDRANMTRLLRPFGYRWFYEPLDEETSFPKFVGAGLMIASKWPIIKKSALTYQSIVKTTSDYLSKKGALYVAIQKGEKVYNIFGTHLQATYSSKAKRVRMAQAKELKQFKDQQSIPNDEPVIYAGDFNEDYWSVKDQVPALLTELNSEMVNITGDLRYTYDRKNALAADDDPSGWLDYFFISNSNEQPKKATMRAYDLVHSETFKYCSLALNLLYYIAPNSKFCLKAKSTNQLSDHYPVYGVFEF